MLYTHTYHGCHLGVEVAFVVQRQALVHEHTADAQLRLESNNNDGDKKAISIMSVVDQARR